jgi:hypothetical protein
MLILSGHMSDCRGKLEKHVLTLMSGGPFRKAWKFATIAFNFLSSSGLITDE